MANRDLTRISRIDSPCIFSTPLQQFVRQRRLRPLHTAYAHPDLLQRALAPPQPETGATASLFRSSRDSVEETRRRSCVHTRPHQFVGAKVAGTPVG
jgi:hypothetical protein